jgi:hypothetical protein
MNSNFARVLATTERTYAGSLIGKEISFVTQIPDAPQEVTHGIVREVYHNVDGKIMLSVGDFAIRLDDILTVKE